MNETIENRLVFQSVNLIENEEKMYSNTSAKNDIMPPFPASTVQKMCTKPNRVKRAGLQLKSERAEEMEIGLQGRCGTLRPVLTQLGGKVAASAQAAQLLETKQVTREAPFSAFHAAQTAPDDAVPCNERDESEGQRMNSLTIN